MRYIRVATPVHRLSRLSGPLAVAVGFAAFSAVSVLAAVSASLSVAPSHGTQATAFTATFILALGPTDPCPQDPSVAAFSWHDGPQSLPLPNGKFTHNPLNNACSAAIQAQPPSQSSVPGHTYQVCGDYSYNANPGQPPEQLQRMRRLHDRRTTFAVAQSQADTEFGSFGHSRIQSYTEPQPATNTLTIRPSLRSTDDEPCSLYWAKQQWRIGPDQTY